MESQKNVVDDKTIKPPNNLISDISSVQINSRYKFKRVYWKHKTLLYPDNEPLIEIVSKFVAEWNLFLKDQDFIIFAQKLLKAGHLPNLFKIILTVDNGNIFKRIWNNYWIKKYGINSENIIQYMNNDEWRLVLTNFFIGSSQWITSWLPIGFISDLTSLLKKSQISAPSSKNPTENNSKISREPTSSSILEQTEVSRSLEGSHAVDTLK